MEDDGDDEAVAAVKGGGVTVHPTPVRSPPLPSKTHHLAALHVVRDAQDAADAGDEVPRVLVQVEAWGMS